MWVAQRRRLEPKSRKRRLWLVSCEVADARGLKGTISSARVMSKHHQSAQLNLTLGNCLHELLSGSGYFRRKRFSPVISRVSSRFYVHSVVASSPSIMAVMVHKAKFDPEAHLHKQGWKGKGTGGSHLPALVFLPPSSQLSTESRPRDPSPCRRSQEESWRYWKGP